jgi:hypothetical protein
MIAVETLDSLDPRKRGTCPTDRGREHYWRPATAALPIQSSSRIVIVTRLESSMAAPRDRKVIKKASSGSA